MNVDDRKKQAGFTMYELLVVIAILGIVIGVAVPNLIKARQSANAASAIASLRTVTTAERLYGLRYSVYATLAQLVPEGTLDTNLQSGAKSNYFFSITVSADLASYTCNADPTEATAALPHYFVDDTAVIRQSSGAPADASSLPIQ